MKINKAFLFGFTLVVYIILMGAALFPHYKSNKQFLLYLAIIMGLALLAFIMFKLFKKGEKDKKNR